MPDTREIFSLRKQGRIDDALRMATELFELHRSDEWTIKAYAWCLYDKIKFLIVANNYTEAQRLGNILEQLPIQSSDDVLHTSIERILLNLNPNRKLISEAKETSKAGNHEAAINILKKAKTHFPNDTSIDEGIAWELYKLKKTLFDQKPVPLLDAKKVLAEYIRLKNPRPSIIHSQFLRLSDKIIDGDGFNSVQFLKMWDLNNLRDEDFQPNIYEGKSYPSLAEKAIQHGSKAVIEKRIIEEIPTFLPFLELAIGRFPENIWLNYYKVKFLQLSGKGNEALKFVIPIAKLKSDEFWTWGLLGELYFESNKGKSKSCYCKALLCKAEEKFVSNNRIRLSQILIEDKQYDEAKTEIASVIRTKTAEGYKPSNLLIEYTKQNWYINAKELENNENFYKLNKGLAEEVLFEDLPWININLGEQYILPEKPNKPRRKIYALTKENIVEEISMNESKLKGIKNRQVGIALKMKAEKDKEGKIKIYIIEPREFEEIFDVVPRFKASITKVDKDVKDTIESIRFAFIDNDKLIEWYSKKSNLFSKLDLNVGDPVTIIISQKRKTDKTNSNYSFGIPKYRIIYDLLSINKRISGALYDCIPRKIGIIDHINSEKSILHFIVNRTVAGIVKMSLCKEQFKIGDIIALQLVEVKSEKGNFYQALTCEKTCEELEDGVKRKFMGEFDGNESFGFADNVYISAHLLKDSPIDTGDTVIGDAIISHNKKKGKWGWTAISVEKNCALNDTAIE